MRALCYPAFSLAPHLGTGAILLPNFPELAFAKLRAEQERKSRDDWNHQLSGSPWRCLVHRLELINGCNWAAGELECAGCSHL